MAARRHVILSLRQAVLLILLLFLFTSAVMFYMLPKDQALCNCEKESHKSEAENALKDSLKESLESQLIKKDKKENVKPGGKWKASKAQKLHEHDHIEWGPHRLAVIVPFRDRFEEMMEFVPHMHAYLNKKRVRHKFYIVNQVDGLRFNRASLINVGFLQAEELCDYMAMHDVDLLPLNAQLNYSYPENGPFHVASPELHPKYHYRTFVGGILLLNNKHFRLVNGLSNKYWGWGKEDDEFYVRIKEAHLNVSRPLNITTGEQTFKHIHDRRRRPRDNKRYYDQKMKSRRRDRVTGLDTVQYTIDTVSELTVDEAPVTILNVKLFCDLNLTPWCLTPPELEEIRTYILGQNHLIEEVHVGGDEATKKLSTPAGQMDLSNLVLPHDWKVIKKR